MATVLLTWDWRAQPDMEAFADAVRTLSHGAVDIAFPDTGADFYAAVIADEPLTPERAERILEAGQEEGKW